MNKSEQDNNVVKKYFDLCTQKNVGKTHCTQKRWNMKIAEY